MPNTRRHSYDLNFKLKIVAEAEAVNNNREIAREYGISESMVCKWRNQQHVLYTGELKMTAKRASMGRYRPKDPELDQQLADWFSDQRSQGKNCSCNIYASPLFKFKFSSKYCLCSVMLYSRSLHIFFDICRSISEQLDAPPEGKGTERRSRV